MPNRAAMEIDAAPNNAMSTKLQQRITLVAASIAVLLGVLALVAWVSDRGLTLGPLSGRMRPELAVALVCGGAGIVCSVGGWLRARRLLALVVVVASALVLADWLATGRAGAVFPPSYETSMSAGLVAAALLAIGVGLATLPRWPNASLMLGMVCSGIGLICLLDRALEATSPLPWPDTMASSARTGLAIAVLGFALFVEASRRDPDDRPGRMPWVVGAIGIFGSFLFWNILLSQERAGLDRLLEATASGLRAELSVSVNEVVGEMEILAERSGRSGADPIRWHNRTHRLMRVQPSIVAIDWVAPDGTLLATARSESLATPVTLTYPAKSEIERLEQLGDARAALVQAFPDLPESLRITALVEHTVAGSVLEAVVDMRQLVSNSVTATDLANAIRIAVGDVVVFDNPGTNLAAASALPLRAVNWRAPAAEDWSIAVGPSQNLVISALSPLPNVVLVAGILISLLLAVVWRGNEILRKRATELERAVHVVERQAAELRVAEQSLRELNEDLENRVRIRTEELSQANAYLHEENRLRTRAQLRLTRVNENLRRFDAFISHELRQPLAAMRLWMDLLESTAGSALGEQQRRYLEKSSGEIRRMTRLIEDELRLSKASYGDPPTDPVALNPMLGTVAEELAPRLAEVGGRLEIGDLPVVRASEIQMQQLFTNLLDNAIKYRRSDVAPVIRIERASPSPAAATRQEEGESICEIVVADNGQGFAIEEDADVFDMFSRRAQDESTPGWGIGLAICKRIAERHDGSIWAESEVGRGTRVHIVLPLAERQSDDQDGAAASPRRSGDAGQ